MIIKSKLKDYAMAVCQERYKNMPQYMPTRVSNEFVQKCEAHLMEYIKQQVESRPSKGKTL